jgi:AraC-like DNA-binding protein
VQYRNRPQGNKTRVLGEWGRPEPTRSAFLLSDYATHWRIQLGSRLLRESNRTVATVALEVGYESEAAFSRAFKRMVGMPPAAWKKAQASREAGA